MEVAPISHDAGRPPAPRGRLMPAVVLGATVLLLGVTAIASRSPLTAAPVHAGTVERPGGAYLGPPPLASTLFSIGAILVLSGLYIYMRVSAKLEGAEATKRGGIPKPVRIALACLFGLAGLVLVIWAIDGLRKHHVHPRPLAGPRRHHIVPPPSVVRSFEVPGWLPFAVIGIGLAGGGVLLAGGVLRRGPGPPVEPAGEALRRALGRSLAELDADPDPRRAVIAAYARMEAALAQAGLARRESEAPREYLVRVLADAEMPPAPVRRLSRLFERARFSEHRIDPALRGEALAALRAVRDGLGEAGEHRTRGAGMSLGDPA